MADPPVAFSDTVVPSQSGFRGAGMKVCEAGEPMPVMVPMRQAFDDGKIGDVRGEIRRQFGESRIRDLIRPGMRIAVGVGSRGIDQLVPMVREVIERLKALGASPFVIPAMGSHGGATAEGQIEVLRGYGITEESAGAPVRATMETVELARMDLGVPVCIDRMAYEADGVVVVNRVKSHTSLRTETQSGVMKMLAIGLGKHKGALALHSHGVRNIQKFIPWAARTILEKVPLVIGVASVENAFARVCALEVLPAREIERAEVRLLKLSRALAPSLPVDQMDILIIERMGKDFSGMGMDPHVVGRWKIWGEPELERPRITTVVVLDLSDASRGNAGGIGLADIVTRRLFDKIDFTATYTNAMTATYLARVQIPVTVDTDRDAVAAALRVCGQPDIDKARVVRIRNTLHLSDIWVSQSIFAELKGKKGMVEAGSPATLSFDPEGNLL